jgi:titin
MGAYTGGAWIDLAGGDEVDTLLTRYTYSGGLRRGETYTFRYRVKNSVGWGEFSAGSSAVAADPPSRPPSAPKIVGDPTASSVTLQFEREAIDDGGSPITGYILEKCQDNSAQSQCLQDAQFSVVGTYTGTVSHTLTVAADGLLPGQVYKLRYRATNAVGGNGLASEAVSVALADKPAAPALITKRMAYSSKTSINLEWSEVTVPAGQSPGGDILGYVLYATDPANGTTWEAFNGVALGLRDQTKASILGLETGKAYQFRVVAHAFNGAGHASSDFSFYVCVLPSKFAAPARVASATSSIEISWAPPLD